MFRGLIFDEVAFLAWGCLAGVLVGCWPPLPPASPASGGVQGRPVQLEQVVGDRHEVQLPEPVFGVPRQETVQPTGHLNGFGAAVAGNREQLVRQLAGVGEDPLQHGQQMGGVTGLVADRRLHDHLVVSIDRHLAVVTLNPAASAFCRASALAASASRARASPGMKHMY